jgi:transcriptional accessory protein Tex/SPT6
MDDETLEALVRRLTALVVKLDERDDHLMEFVEEQRALNARLTVAIEGINTTLANVQTLVKEVFRDRTNGRTD